MAKQVFTILAGADKGRRFELGDAPLEIGRDQARDLALKDDRVSRHHATLRFEGERIVLIDENSSNGTFLNGKLIDKTVVREGDIITIGYARMICDSAPPSALPTLVCSRKSVFPAAAAQGATQILPHSAEVPGLKKETVEALEIIESVAQNCLPQAQIAGMQITVESDTVSPGGSAIFVDRHLLHDSLVALVALVLETAGVNGGTLALRYTRDLWKGGGRINLVAVLFQAPVDRMVALHAAESLREIQESLRRSGGVLQLLPGDPPGALASVRLFGPPNLSTGPTVVR